VSDVRAAAIEYARERMNEFMGSITLT